MHVYIILVPFFVIVQHSDLRAMSAEATASWARGMSCRRHGIPFATAPDYGKSPRIERIERIERCVKGSCFGTCHPVMSMPVHWRASHMLHT
jgi:hypothetical protein